MITLSGLVGLGSGGGSLSPEPTSPPCSNETRLLARRSVTAYGGGVTDVLVGGYLLRGDAQQGSWPHHAPWASSSSSHGTCGRRYQPSAWASQSCLHQRPDRSWHGSCWGRSSWNRRGAWPCTNKRKYASGKDEYNRHRDMIHALEHHSNALKAFNSRHT
jgi:hypothetical protein